MRINRVLEKSSGLQSVIDQDLGFGNVFSEDSPAVDFFDIKGDVEDLARASQHTQDLSYTAGTHPAYQAGQYADISAKGRTVGRIGRISSVLLTELDIAGPVFAFELDWKLLQQGQMPTYSERGRQTVQPHRVREVQALARLPQSHSHKEIDEAKTPVA